MPGNKRPAKKHRPRVFTGQGSLTDYVIAGTKPAPAPAQTSLGILVHDAMYHLVRGQGTAERWGEVRDALAVTLVLCRMGAGKCHVGDVELARAAHERCGRRKAQAGNYGYAIQELEAVNFALEIHAEQLATTTVANMEKAINTAAALIDQERAAQQQPLEKQ